MRVLAALLIVGGVLGLVYGGFNYTKESREAKLGPITVAVEGKQRVTVPIWAGVVAIAVGGVLLLVPGRIG